MTILKIGRGTRARTLGTWFWSDCWKIKTIILFPTVEPCSNAY